MRKLSGIVIVAAVLGLVAWAALRPRQGLVPDSGPFDLGPGSRAQPRQPGFREMARGSGIRFHMSFLPGEQGETFKINLYDHGCGLAVGDYDGDGHDDIYFCNQLGPNALYRNNGRGSFQDVTSQSGPIQLNDRICVGATFADYDDDGDQDLYVTSTRGGNVLFQNDGQGRFRDVTEEAGVACVGHSQTAGFFDADQDGDLDLLVINTAAWTTNEYNDAQRYYVGPADLLALSDSLPEENLYFRNNGDGTFDDATAESGLQGRGWAGDMAVLDYDEDGRLDVLITNMFGLSQLYHNEGEGRFQDVTVDALQRTSYGGVGAKAFDYDNDGHLDLYIVDMHSDMWMAPALDPALIDERAKYGAGDLTRPGITPAGVEAEMRLVDKLGDDYPRMLFGNSFFRNLGNGKFEEISGRAGAETFWPWGIATGDFDNDGFQDAFLPSGMGYPFAYWRNYLLMNNGDGRFRDQAGARGLDPPPLGEHLPQGIGGLPAPRSSRCAATSDFDGDGRLDLIVNNFNDYPYLYRNEMPKRNYVQFRLRATRGNRDAIGATVRLRVGEQTMVRQVNPAGGYLSQSSKTLHFGLGDHESVDRAEIRWPSGHVQTIEGPAVNTLHEISEDTPQSPTPES